MESPPLETPPQFRAIAPAGGPLLVEPLQMHLERTLPNAEDIGASAAEHLANKAAAVAGAAHDLLDRGALLGQIENERIDLL